MISDLGDHGFADTDSDTKVRMLQDSIWEIEGLRPWPFLETRIDLTFDGTSGLATNFPANFRTALSLKDLDSGVVLSPAHVQDVEIASGISLDVSGTPWVYYSEADQLRLFPQPMDGASVRMRYIRFSDPIEAETLEAAVSVPLRHHRVIVLGALMRLYNMEDDAELGQVFQAQYEARIERMVDDLFRKQLDRPEHVRVTDPDSWDY